MVLDYWLPASCDLRLLDNSIIANRISIVFAMFNKFKEFGIGWRRNCGEAAK
jgi:hypothetical protein